MKRCNYVQYVCLSVQYSYNKHLHLREDLQQPLLVAETGTAAAAAAGVQPPPQQQQGEQQQQQQQAADYHFLASKLFWAGIALLLFALGLLALTLYTLLAPPV